MSLMHLLSVGRTFGGGREKQATYRVVNGVVPDFAVRSREADPGPPPDLAAGRGRRVDDSDPPPPQKVVNAVEVDHRPAAPVSSEAESEAQPPLEETLASVTSSPNVARPRSFFGLGQDLRSTGGRVTLENRRRRHRRGEKTDPAQRELSLGTVRVVRNDLSAADLELTEGRSGGSAAAKGLPLFDREPSAAKSPLSFVRLLRWFHPGAAGV